MSEFNSNPSKIYLETVSKLKALLDEEDIGSVEAAFAEAVQEKRMKQAHFGSNVRKTPGKVMGNIGKFLGKQQDSYWFPGWDHVSMILKRKNPIALVSQPYGLHKEELEGVIKFCNEYGLNVNLSPQESWHYPGRTMLMKFTKSE